MRGSQGPEPGGWFPRHSYGFRAHVSALLAGEDERTRYPEPEGLVLKRHQKAIRTFMAGGSPYRGLLLYHGLGSGKSCAAAAAAEAIGSERVIVLLPASLKAEFRAEMGKCGSRAPGEVHYLSSNGVEFGKIDQVAASIKGVSLHNSTLIIDEVHNLASQVSNGGKRGQAMYNAIMNARMVKIIALSGTPIVNSPHELAFLFNLMNGPIRTVVIKDPTVDGDEMTRALDRHVLVDTYRFDGKRLEVVPVAEGFERVDAESEAVRASQTLPSPKRLPHAGLLEELMALFGGRGTRGASNLFPIDREEFEKMYTSAAPGDRSGRVIREDKRAVLQRRISGLVSHYKIDMREAKKGGFPDVLELPPVRLPMTDMQYDIYVEVRKAEVDKEKEIKKQQQKRKKKGGRDDSSEASGVYRAFSRAICNFAFEKRTDRVFPSDLRAMVKDLDDKDAKQNAEALSEAYAGELRRSLGLLTEEQLTGDGLASHSPKMSAIMRGLEGGPKPALVYSQFRVLEGIGIFARVLMAHGYRKVSFAKDGTMRSELSGGRDGSRRGESGRDKTGRGKTGRGESSRDKTGRGKTGRDQPGEKTFAVFDSSDPGNAHMLEMFNRKDSPIHVLLISQSAAEGINLVGVRQVHIMEPYWNETRIQQVIGRAARATSHAHLTDMRERTVTVHRYLMTLEDPKHRGNKTIMGMDMGMTTDEAIFKMASDKMTLVNLFLDAIRSAAIDCKGGSCMLVPEAQRGRSDKTFDLFSNTDARLLRVRKDGAMYLLDTSDRTLYDAKEYDERGKLVRV